MELGSGRRKRATVGVEVAGKSHTIERGGKSVGVKKTGGALGRGRRGTLEGSEKCFSPSSPLFPCLSSEPGGRVGAGEGGEGGRRRCQRRNGYWKLSPWMLGALRARAWWRIADSDRRARKFAKSPATFLDQG